MRHSINIKKENKKPYLLIEDKDTLLTHYMKIKNAEGLYRINSLKKINSEFCFLYSGTNFIRVAVILPFILIITINLFQFISNIYVDWNKCEEQQSSEILRAIKYIAENKSNLSSQEEQIINNRILELRSFTDNNLNMSLNDYLYYRYNIYAYGRKYFWNDIVHIIYYSIFIPILLYVFFLIKEKPPLILINNRKIFVTWVEGKVYVARYSQIGVIETASNITMVLYGLKNKNKLVKNIFILYANPLIIFSTEKQRKDLLAFITKYMVWGLSAVASTEYERNMPYYLRKDKKPDDFEQQVDEILAVLDKLDSPRELNTLTHIKGK